MTSAPVLVTAALGNVGRQVVRACLARGLTVRAGGRDVAALARAFPDAAPVRLDLRDRATWPAALAGCAGVFLLRPPPIGDMDATLIPFVDQARAAGVAHLTFLSVAGADRMRWVPHRKVERHLAATGTAWTVLRPGFFAQNLEDAYRRDLVEDGRLYVPAGDGRVAFVDVADVGEVAALTLAEPDRFRGQLLTLTGPEAIGFADAAAILTRALGRPIRYQPASLVGYLRHLRRRGLAWGQIAVQTILHLGLRRGDAAEVDPTLARLLGHRPRTLADHVADARAAWMAPVTSGA